MGAFDWLLGTKKWHIRNEETGGSLEGQFPPEGLTREVSNNWAQHTALGRKNPISQYLNSEADKLSFQGMFYARDALINDAQKDIEQLIDWARQDPGLGRPPIVTFWLGNGHVEQLSVIDSISGIKYGEPNILGDMRKVEFTVNLLQYKEFNLGDTEATDTRYHRAKDRDYYELLTWREYKDALIGDVIRKRHPSKPNLLAGSIVKLPSVAGIRTEKVEPKSIALRTSTGRKDTPQRALRQSVLDNRNREYISHVVIE